MKNYLLVLTLSLLLPVAVQAQSREGTCATYSTADANSNCVVMRFMGRRGVWLPLERSEMLRKEHDAFPKLTLQVGQLESSVKLLKEEASLLRKSIDERKAAIVILEKELTASQLSEAKALEKNDAFYRKPWFWLCVGVVLGVAGTAAIAI